MSENTAATPRTVLAQKITGNRATWPAVGDHVVFTDYPQALPEAARPDRCRAAGYCRHQDRACDGAPELVTKEVTSLVLYMDNSTAARFADGDELLLAYPSGDVCF